MRLHAIIALMPDRPDAQLVLLDPEGRFGLSKLDVGFPHPLAGPVGDAGAQGIGALCEDRLIVEGRVDIDLQAQACRRGRGFEDDPEPCGGALLLLQDPSDLAVDL